MQMIDLCNDILRIIFNFLKDESYVAIFICKELRALVLNMDIGVYHVYKNYSTLEHYRLLHNYIGMLESKNFHVKKHDYIKYLLVKNNLVPLSSYPDKVMNMCIVNHNNKLFFDICHHYKTEFINNRIKYFTNAVQYGNHDVFEYIVNTYTTEVIEWLKQPFFTHVPLKTFAHTLINKGIEFNYTIAKFIYKSDPQLFTELVNKRGIVRSIKEKLPYVSIVINHDELNEIFSLLNDSDIDHLYYDSFMFSDSKLTEELKKRIFHDLPRGLLYLNLRKSTIEYYMKIGLTLDAVKRRCYTDTNTCNEICEHLIIKGIMDISNYTEFIDIPSMYSLDNHELFDILVRANIICIQENTINRIIKSAAYGCLLKLGDDCIHRLSKIIFADVNNGDYESSYNRYKGQIRNIPLSIYYGIARVTYYQPYTLFVSSSSEKELLCRNILIKSFLGSN